jgi:hypothetical protein
MTTEEKLDVMMKSHEYLQAGNNEDADRLILELPMQPYMAKFAKEFLGADFLIKGGYDLSEAEAEFGPNWLAK